MSGEFPFRQLQGQTVPPNLALVVSLDRVCAIMDRVRSWGPILLENTPDEDEAAMTRLELADTLQDKAAMTRPD